MGHCKIASEMHIAYNLLGMQRSQHGQQLYWSTVYLIRANNE